MVYLSDDRFITEFSRAHAPALRVHSGDTVAIRTLDCYLNNLRAENDPRGAAPGPARGCNPSTGPIWVEGAQPGDTLACEIVKIEIDGYATMRISERGGFMKQHVTSPIVRAIALKDGRAQLAGVDIPLDPMIGVIGVAPLGQPVDTATPGAHGGNMDTRLIREGSTVYLPVGCEGALFALGDVHAQMGDGEVCICGLECPATVTVRLTTIKHRAEPWPVVKSDEGFSTVCSAETLDGAARLAADAMLQFLEKRTQIEHNELILLMSLICDLQISQVVDPLLTCRMTLRKGALVDMEF